MPVKDGLAGKQTYGAGRYLLDTVKGADLGGDVDLATGRGHAGRRPELRLQPVLRLRPGVGLPAGPARATRCPCPVPGGELYPVRDPAE